MYLAIALLALVELYAVAALWFGHFAGAFEISIALRGLMPVALAANAASLAPSTLCESFPPALGRLDSRAHWTPSLVRISSGQFHHLWLFHAPRARESPA